MAAVKAGDKVTIVQREVTPEDIKSSLYFSYFGGLTGTVDRIYDDDTVCVEIDMDSLTEGIRKRHQEIQEAERKRWLEGLSGEVRNRLTEEQKQLKMSYKILVGSKDLQPHKGGTPKKAKSEGDESESAGGSDDKGSEKTPEAQKESSKTDEAPTPKRLSKADLDAAEEEFFKSRG